MDKQIQSDKVLKSQQNDDKKFLLSEFLQIKGFSSAETSFYLKKYDNQIKQTIEQWVKMLNLNK